MICESCGRDVFTLFGLYGKWVCEICKKDPATIDKFWRKEYKNNLKGDLKGLMENLNDNIARMEAVKAILNSKKICLMKTKEHTIIRGYNDG